MHNYSVQDNHDDIVLTVLIIIAGFLDSIIDVILPNLFPVKNYYILIFLIAFVSTYYALFLLFDRFLWKQKCIRKLIKYPNINGHYEGTICSDNYQEIETNVEIIQTWTKIIMILKTETAESETKALMFYNENSKNFKMSYIYYNKVKNNEGIDMHSHGGTGLLTIYKDKLEGEYYTDRERKTYGKIVLYKSLNQS